MIRETCEEKNATFVNNDLNFTYRDGSCDEAAFVKDGNSPFGVRSFQATFDRIIVAENRNSKDDYKQADQSSGARNGPAASAPRRSVSRNTPAEPAWHIVGQCRQCGESNHVTKKCRHEVAVTCFTCGQKGHKNNHHHHPSR